MTWTTDRRKFCVLYSSGQPSVVTKKEKSLDKSEMEKKENVGINSETRQIGVLKGFDEQDCFKISYPKILRAKIQKWRLAKMVRFKKKPKLYPGTFCRFFR